MWENITKRRHEILQYIKRWACLVTLWGLRIELSGSPSVTWETGGPPLPGKKTKKTGKSTKIYFKMITNHYMPYTFCDNNLNHVS